VSGMARNPIRVQDLGRVRQIATALARNGFGHVFSRIGLGAHLPAAKAEDASSPAARRARQVLVDLGPTFVKLGQILSVRPDILPEDMLSEFESLQDRVEPMPFSAVRAVIESELGTPLEERFSFVDEEPLGSASIAQVHRAVMLDGTEVAIKLQRQGIEAMIRSDLSILYTLAELLEGRVEVPGMHTPVDIVREFETAIVRELDFLQEMRAAQRVGANFKGSGDVVIPKVYPQWCTRRMLVMELLKGEPLGRAMERMQPEEAGHVAHRVMDAIYCQVFDHGFFHGDPHPGNIFLMPDGRIAFLDFGVTGLLTGNMQDTLLLAFTSLVFRDPDTLAMTVYRAGATSERIDLRELRDACEHLMVKYHGASLDDIASPTTLMEVVRVASRFRITLPPEFAVLSRSVALIEGICRKLLPGLDIVAEVQPYAQRLMRSRFSTERVAADVARLVFQAQSQFRDLPTQSSQVMMDLQAGRLTFNFRDLEAERNRHQLEYLRDELRMGGLRVAMALMASTVSIIAVGLLVAASQAPLYWAIGFSLAGMGGLGLATTLYGALGVHVFFAGLLDLRGWRRRIFGLLRFFTWRKTE